jgi:hypothetical protein
MFMKKVISIIFISLTLIQVTYALTPFSPREDKRCNEKFIQQFSTKQDCLRNGEPSACLYLGIIAAGGVIGTATASAIKAANPSKVFLDKFTASYELIQNHQAQLRKLRNIYIKVDQKIHDMYNEDLTKKVARKLGESKTDYEMRLEKELDARAADYQNNPEVRRIDSEKTMKLRSELTIKELSLPENAYLRNLSNRGNVNHTRSKDLNTIQNLISNDTIAAVEKIYATEMNELKKLKDQSAKQTNELANKADPQYIDDVNRLKTESSKPGLSEEKLSEINKRLADRREKYFSKTASVRRQMSEKLASALAKSPELTIVNNIITHQDLAAPETIISTAPLAEIKKAAKQTANKRVARAGLVGGVASVLMFEGLSIAAEKQIDNCADELKLTSAEVNLIKPYLRAPKLISCNTIRLQDPKEVLLDAKDTFGYVPAGICELALRESQVLDVFAGNENSLKVTCDEVKGEGFASKKNSDGAWTFNCNETGSDLNYSMPIDQMGRTLFEQGKIKATFEKDGRVIVNEAKASELLAGIEKLKKGDYFHISSNRSYENSTSKGATFSKSTDSISCYQKALINQSIAGILASTCPKYDNTDATKKLLIENKGVAK